MKNYLFLVFLIFFPIHTFAQVNYADIQKNDNQKILVILDERLVEFHENDSLKFSATIRIGKDSTPTPVGRGFIYEKRPIAYFHYTIGPQAGQRIIYSTCEDGNTFRIDYSKIRALAIYYEEMEIDLSTQRRLRLPDVGAIRYSLHSVTCPETVGRNVSSGCVGLTIPEMLDLYTLVDVGAKVRVIRSRSDL